MHILIIKMSSMGDILHVLPALVDAADAIPGICFDWVVEESFVTIPTWNSEVRKVIPIAIRRWRKNWFSKAVRQERYNFKCQLQREHYDVIIDAQGLMKSAALVTRIARGEKHGLDYKSAREPFSSFFYHYRHSVRKKQHAIERMRQLFAASLDYQLPDTPCTYAIDTRFPIQSSKEVYLVFLHATTCFNKQWPEEHWRALIRLAANAGYHIKLPCWTRNDYLRAKRLAKGFSVTEVLLRLTLVQIASKLAGATAIVSVDTGLSHLASALNRPNLTLYGPTDPDLIGVYGRHQKSLRAENGSMKSITVEYVWKTLLSLLLSER